MIQRRLPKVSVWARPHVEAEDGEYQEPINVTPGRDRNNGKAWLKEQFRTSQEQLAARCAQAKTNLKCCAWALLACYLVFVCNIPTISGLAFVVSILVGVGCVGYWLQWRVAKAQLGVPVEPIPESEADRA